MRYGGMEMENKEEKNLEHDGGCCKDCSCEEEELEFGEDDDIMYLTLDDDTELVCNVLGIFEVEEKEYIALVPVDQEEVLIYQYLELEDEDFDLLSIEEEDEFETVSRAFYELFEEDSMEYGSYEDLEDEE